MSFYYESVRAGYGIPILAACILQSTSAAATPDGRPAIVAFGDSLTAGFGAEPGSSYPDFLQRELDRRGLKWRIVNAGVSGDTTTDGLNRVSDVLSYRPAIVILEFGGNDGLRGLPLDTTRGNLDRMIAELQKGGARVILAGMTLPPNYGPDYIRPFEKMYADLALKYRIPRIHFLLAGVGGDAKLMQRDGLHPTAAGNAIVARTVFATLEPVLKTVKSHAPGPEAGFRPLFDGKTLNGWDGDRRLWTVRDGASCWRKPSCGITIAVFSSVARLCPIGWCAGCRPIWRKATGGAPSTTRKASVASS